MFESIIYSLGYLGLFIATFVASTLVPLSSEIFVVLAIIINYNPFLVLIFATFGNFFGSLTNYYLGKYGNKFFLSKYVHEDSKHRKRAEKLYHKYGAPILFFSWLPGIGDPLCIIPGVLNVDIKKFSFWVFLGKFFRFLVVIIITLIVKNKFF